LRLIWRIDAVPEKQRGEWTLRVQEQRSLVYVGPLAGRRPGIVTTKEGLVLVTNGFTLIEPKKSDWPFIRRMFDERMGGGTGAAFALVSQAGLRGFARW
jgi:hypothetical protein